MSASLPVPDMDARLTNAEQASLRREIIVHFCNKQGDWIDGVLKKLMPVELYKMAHNTNGPMNQFIKRQEAVRSWLDKNDVRIVQQGTTQQIFKGTELLSTFGMKLAEK